jgi:hypothetical protein
MEAGGAETYDPRAHPEKSILSTMTAPGDVGEIPLALDRLVEAVSRLEGALGGLESKLAPVITGPSLDEVRRNPESPSSSSVAIHVDAQVGRLEGLIDFVASLNRRVGL